MRRTPELVAVSALMLVVLAWGGAAGPHPWDVGELVAAAARLGGSHPPGQPLHALLGHAIGWLPLGSIVLRVSWLSSFATAVAAFALGRTVLALLDREDAAARAAAVVVALTVPLVPAVLRNAMRPEVYTLALACVALGAWALAERARDWPHGLRVAAIAAGLAFALHPPHALALAGMALVACVMRQPRRAELGSSILLGLVTTIALLAYLPIRGAAGAPMWGEPTTAAGLWAYVSGAAYQRNLGAADGDAAAVLLYVAGSAPLIVLAIAALRDRAVRLPWGMALVAVIAALLQPFEERNPDNVAYDAPAIVLVLVAAAITLVRAPGRLPWALALVPIAPLVLAIEGRFLRPADVPVLETLAFETLSAPSPRALLITRSDFVSASVMLGQEVDRQRPDVAHFVEGLATSSWHWTALGAHPLFDGQPHRGPEADARVAYVTGALAVARGHVEIGVENELRVAPLGTVRGALVVDGPPLVDDRATSERVMAGLVDEAVSGPAGDHAIGIQIVRDVVLRRAPMLYARVHATAAGPELRSLAPVAADAIAAIGPRVPPLTEPPVVRDPAFALAGSEDVVRLVAVLLDRAGSPDAAARVLEAQQGRGDDLALVQLAAIDFTHGRLDAARTAFAAYRSRHPDIRSPMLDALASSLR